MVVAILGTTISPYLFFWQAAQEVEDTKAQPARETLAPGSVRLRRERSRASSWIRWWGWGFPTSWRSRSW